MEERYRVAVVMGGTSAERQISIISGTAIAQGLRDADDTVYEVVANDHELRELDDLPVDVVFIALHGPWGEDGRVQELLESRDLPYTGSGVLASRRGMDKFASKALFEGHGVPTAPYRAFSAQGPADELLRKADELGYPVVVKPRAQGSSIGVHIVHRPDELTQAVADALSYGAQGFMEAFIPGREVTVGILDEEPLPIIELRPRREFFDFQAKYEEGLTEHVFDIPISPECYRWVQEAALAAYQLLGCRGFARVDMRLSEEPAPYVLEVNTIPGFTPVSLFPEAARRRGIDFPQLCHQLVTLALRSSVAGHRAGVTSEQGGQ